VLLAEVELGFELIVCAAAQGDAIDFVPWALRPRHEMMKLQKRAAAAAATGG
jgi:hypothetical protein